MKAEELMIGDLVRVSEEGLCIKKGTIVKVCSIDSEDRLVYKGKELIGAAHCKPIGDPRLFDGGVWCEYLEPIPITPEILHKNGFKYEGTAYWELRGDGGLYIRVCPQQPDNDDWWSSDMTGFEIMSSISDALIEGVEQIYVHQFQHALRLCGIEKEIVI